MDLYKNKNITSIEYTRNVFRIKWRLTGWCNYHCPYCIDRLNKENKGEWNSFNLLLERAKKLNLFLINNNITKPIHLSLLGGEVTYLDLKQIISEISNISNINLTTNFSKDVDYFKDLFIWCKNKGIKLFINCSYHEENKNFYDKFIELNNWCLENHFSTPRLSRVITDSLDIEKWLKPYISNGISKIMLTKNKNVDNDEFEVLDIKQVYDNLKITNTYESNKKKMLDYKVTFKNGKEEYFNSISSFLNNLDNNGFIPDGYYCNCGINGIMINWDGNIYGSHCFELENKSLGNIDTDNVKLNKDYYYCNNPNIRCCLRNGTSVYRRG